MRPGLASVLLGAALASCTSQADTQLEAIKSSRSVLAEWALVEQQGAKHRVTDTYLTQMREQARDQLRTAREQLSGAPAATLDQVLEGKPDAAQLDHAGSSLKPVEDQLERS
jgi:hypothetical protein